MEENTMVFTPNDPLGGPGRNPDLRTTPIHRRRSSWGLILVIAVVAIAGFAYYNYMAPTTDPQTTAATTQGELQPAPAPVAPAAPSAPAANNGAPAPAAPPASGNP
jgi:hypothetical protein